MAHLCLAVFFMCLAISVLADKCAFLNMDNHLKVLDEMIDAQLLDTCSVEVKLIDESKLEGYCYNKIEISQLENLLTVLNFKPHSQYYNHTQNLIKLYNEGFKQCIGSTDIVNEEDLSRCSHSVYLSPAEILDRIKIGFLIFRDFKYDPNHDCYGKYSMCEEGPNHSTKGPQCSCPSPTPILPGQTTEKPMSKLPEIKSTPYASVIPSSTVLLTEYMSGTETQNPPQSSESVEMSSVILTNIPTDAQLVTTIMDHLHATTTDRLVSGPESPQIKMDNSYSGMEFTKDITESTYATSLSQSRTFKSKDLSRYNTESLHTDGSLNKWLSTTTVVNKDFSQITEELSSGTEPAVDELLEITELNTVSPTLVTNSQTFFESSMEAGAESSSSSSNTVTKMRRSVENVDKTLEAHVSTHAQPVLVSDDSATKSPHLTFPPTFKSHHTMSQEGKVTNLGWAASYLFSTVATTKPASTEAKMSSPVSEDQPLSLEGPLHLKQATHEGGYTNKNIQQQEQNVTAIKSGDSVADPPQTFRMLPIPETEPHQDGRQINLLLVMIPSFLAIGLLCILLYVLHHYRILKRQLNRQQKLEEPEEQELRPLAV